MEASPKRKAGRPKKLERTIHFSARLPEDVVKDIESTWAQYIERVESSSPYGKMYSPILKSFNQSAILRAYIGLMIQSFKDLLLKDERGLLVFYSMVSMETLCRVINSDSSLTAEQRAAMFYSYLADEERQKELFNSSKDLGKKVDKIFNKNP